jgi:hypothetical protein
MTSIFDEMYKIKVADKEYTGRKTSVETTLSQVDEA